MPKVQTNLVCKVTSHLKSKTHNIALSDVIAAKKVKTATKKGTDAAVTNTFLDAKQLKILVAVTFRRCFEKEDGQDIACAISWLLVAKHDTRRHRNVLTGVSALSSLLVSHLDYQSTQPPHQVDSKLYLECICWDWVDR